MRRALTITMSTAALLGLAACGGSSDPLTQEQTREVLLTQDDFPLEGFTTSGSITEHDPDAEDDSDLGEIDVFEDFPGGDQVSQECRDAMSAMSTDVDTQASSSIDFSGPEDAESLLGAPAISLAVAVVDGDSPLKQLPTIVSECGEITVEESGMSFTINFEEVEGVSESMKISMDILGQAMEMSVAGREEGGNIVMVSGTGLSDADVVKILDAQQEKINNL